MIRTEIRYEDVGIDAPDKRMIMSLLEARGQMGWSLVHMHHYGETKHWLVFAKTVVIEETGHAAT